VLVLVLMLVGQKGCSLEDISTETPEGKQVPIEVLSEEEVPDFDAQVIVGKNVEYVPSIDPMTGEKGKRSISLSHSAIFYLYDNTEYLRGINIQVSGLVKEGEITGEGKSLPVFTVDVMAVQTTDDITGDLIQSFQNHSFLIGKSKNSFSINKAVDPGKRIAVKLSVDLSDPQLEELGEYYFTIRAKREGSYPVNVSVFSVPLHKYEWRNDILYDADISFEYRKGSPG